MALTGAQQRLEFLTRQLSPPEWRVLGAIAVERELALSPILRLAGAFGLGLPGKSLVSGIPPVSSRAPLPFAASTARRISPARTGSASPLPALDGWLASGLLTEVGAVRSQTLGRAGSEPVFAVHADFRQLVIRRAARTGELEALVEATRGVLGERSLGPSILLIQSGHLTEFQRYAYALPRAAGRLGEEVTSEELLREAVTRPFDATWFEGVFRDAALPTAERVLSDALLGLHECDELFAWARERVPSGSAAAAVAELEPDLLELEQTLAEHALLRGRPELVESHADTLPRVLRLAFHAAAAYQSGDQAAAQRWLDALAELPDKSWLAGSSERGEPRRERARGAPGIPDLGSAAPLIALLFFSRGTAPAQNEAKRWLAARTTGDTLARAERGFRTLLRYSTLPEAECARLDVHQIGRGASAWELLLYGLTVHLHLKQDVTRAAWSAHLTRTGAAWIEAGYSWLGRQALLLARALDPSHFERELNKVPALSVIGPFEQRPGEFALCDLITPKPEWERVLDALEQVAAEPSPEAEGGRRVAWFVNLNEPALDRPALQELSQSGWSRGRRLLPAQLHEHLSELPPEDVAVLRCSREVADGKREFLPEAFEALIGHPRVYDGARGGSRVEVVRGSCRVETNDDGGYLSIRVEPAGARLGVNVVADGPARLSVYRVTAAMQRVIDVLPHGVRIPRQRAEQALSVLGKLSLGVEVQSRHLGADRKVEADATPCLRISPHAGAWVVQAGVRPFGARGRFFLAGAGRTALSSYSGGERLLCVRDLVQERVQLSRLISDCPTLLERVFEQVEQRVDGAGSWDLGLEPLLDLLLELRETSERVAVEWPESEAMAVRGRVTTQSLSGSLRRKKGWYLATGGASLDDQTEIGLGEIAASVSVGARGRFVRLPNGDFLALEERVRQTVAALQGAEPLAQRPRELKIHEAALDTLDTLAALGTKPGEKTGGFELDAETQSFLARVESVKQSRFDAPD
ncbi:MAG TPA: hypothetical protein VG963_31145, partial [Polyangiaceae bacterium]|nr:hypothetical protein [Polyangiaceae bacterium]